MLKSLKSNVFVCLIFSVYIPTLSHADAHTMFEEEAELEMSSMDLGNDGAWNRANNPRSWGSTYEYRFDQLPLSGKMDGHTPWSDTYWPSNRAGIAARWNLPGSDGFKYRLYSENEVRVMPKNELAKLSPAEKYDIFMGRFDYPTVKMVRGSTSASMESWNGICHGWAPASLNHPEPGPVTVKSSNGIEVSFGSSDVKALIDQYYATYARASEFLGMRCKRGGGGNIFRRIAGVFSSSSACNDTHAGAFHIVMSNELGIKRRGFVADVDSKRQVWNQPIYAFDAKVVGERRPHEGAAPGTRREVLIHAVITYTKEINATWNPVVGTSSFSKESKAYDYALELDSSGRIIGGSYYLKSNRARPDFLWNTTKLQFTGYYEGINRIYQPALL